MKELQALWKDPDIKKLVLISGVALIIIIILIILQQIFPGPWLAWMIARAGVLVGAALVGTAVVLRARRLEKEQQ